jgi:peptide/nickel transport system permease protein
VEHPTTLSYLLDVSWHLFAPAFVLAIGGIAVMSRYVRSSMMDVMSEDYVRTARAKGLDETVVFYKHALRNSLRPVVTFIGLSLPGLLGGAVIIETIFGYPGMGRLGFEAVLERDYPVLVTLNFIGAVLVLAGNLLSDILYAVVDPRVRLE